MTTASLEREILKEARIVFCNKKLHRHSIIEWNTGSINCNEKETQGFLPVLQVNVCILKTNDMRKKTE